MIIELDAPERVAAGDSVRFVLRIVNAGTEPLELMLTGRPVAFDVIVSTPEGEPVWSRLHGDVVTMILQLRTLGPGEALEFEAGWDQTDVSRRPVPPGEYIVQGILPLEDDERRSPARRLRIED